MEGTVGGYEGGGGKQRRSKFEEKAKNGQKVNFQEMGGIGYTAISQRKQAVKDSVRDAALHHSES